MNAPDDQGGDNGERAPEERAARRDEGRQWAYQLQQDCERDGRPSDWFEALYQKADGEAGYIPWEMAAPRFKLRQWLAANPGDGRRAIDVGCGLGDNAACLNAAGYTTTAFDLSETAVKWAAERFSGQNIDFTAADLFNTPQSWHGAFDLVHETYNLQAMGHKLIAPATTALAKLVKPGGKLLVITRARDEDQQPDGPPWPLARSQLNFHEDTGLELTEFEEFDDERPEPIRHFLAVYRRATSTANP